MSAHEASPLQSCASAREYTCKCARVQIISGWSVLNIDDGSHDQVLDVDFSP